MKLVYKVVSEVVNFKVEAEDTTAEEADAAKEEDVMAIVDVEADMAEAEGMNQLAGRAYQMK